MTSAWLLIEQKQYPRALEEVRGAQKALADRSGHSLLVLADLIGGVAEIRAGNVTNAVSRLASLKSRYETDDAVESNWVAALEGEVALAEGRHDDAVAGFKAAQKRAWLTLNRDASTVLAANLPSRDGPARVELARGNRAAAIQEYRRLTAVAPVNQSAAVLEPRHILELARLLDAQGEKPAARIEYTRFLSVWSKADADLPELVEAKRALTPPQ